MLGSVRLKVAGIGIVALLVGEHGEVAEHLCVGAFLP